MTLRVGSKTPAVGEWQTFLARLGWYKGRIDNDFGPKTEQATKDFQESVRLMPTGIVDEPTLERAFPLGLDRPTPVPPRRMSSMTMPAVVAAPPMGKIVLPEIKFIPAKYFYVGRVPGPIDYIVAHSMEAAEKGNTAEATAYYFKIGAPDANGKERKASCQYCIDVDSIVQCVRDSDTAFHAPGVNRNGIGIEHAGFARQTADEWLDAYSSTMLKLSATLAAGKAKEFSIPLEWIDATGLLAGRRGFTTHADVSEACRRAQAGHMVTSPFYNKYEDKPATNHSDPGIHFPKAIYMAWVKEATG